MKVIFIMGDAAYCLSNRPKPMMGRIGNRVDTVLISADSLTRILEERSFLIFFFDGPLSALAL